MKHLKQFESYKIYDDIKDYFLNLIDLGCSYNEDSNIIELKKEKDCPITEIVSEIDQIVSRLDDRMHKIELKLDVNKFHLIIELKVNLELKINVGTETIKLNVIDIKISHENKYSLLYNVKCLDKDNNITYFKIRIWLDSSIANQLDIEYTYNNRKKGLSVDLKDILDLFEKYNPDIKAIDLIKKALNK